MKTNKLMKQIINRLNLSQENKRLISHKYNLINDDLLNLKSVHDCIIISNEDINLSDEEFMSVINSYTDKTGYEASCTEILINHYIDNESIETDELITITLLLIETLSEKLKLMSRNKDFCFIFSVDNDYKYVTLRFHKVRCNEPLWVSMDLEDYVQPIAYIII